MKRLVRVVGVVAALWAGGCWAVSIAPVVDVLLFTLPGDGGAARGVAVTPITPFCELTGATCATDGDTLTVTRQEHTFRCRIGTHAAFRGEEAITLPLVPWRVDGEPYVPLRALVEALGGTVQPPGAGYTVTLPGLAKPLVLREERVTKSPGRFQNTETELYQIDLNGTGLRRLTYTVTGEYQFSILADGRTLVYEREGNICLRALDDPYERILLAGTRTLRYMEPCFSPDGTLISFVKLQKGSGEMQVGVMRRDGTHVRLLGRGGTPCWHPDSRHIAYVERGSLYTDTALYLIGVEGSRRRRLGVRWDSPAFSPDGSRLCCTRYPRSTGGEPNHSTVIVYGLTGPHTGKVYAPPTSAERHIQAYGVFQPGGKLLAFSDAMSGIYTCRSDRTDERQIAAGGNMPLTPIFSPDGQQIVYLEHGMHGTTRLVMIPTQGGNARPVTNWDSLPFLWDYRFLPNGRQILLTAAMRDPF